MLPQSAFGSRLPAPGFLPDYSRLPLGLDAIPAFLMTLNLRKPEAGSREPEAALFLPRNDDPDVGAAVPGATQIISENGADPKPGVFEAFRHLRH
jgi:hypothetical protein